jgi:ubiquinone/menaquinone biosynthesis C-methylase UbiE
MTKTLFPSPSIQNTSKKMFTYGIGCHALLVLHSVGLLPILEKRAVSKKEIVESERYPHHMAIIGALQALTYADIVKDEKQQYLLTESGREVVQDIDMFIHWFNAYGKVMADSVEIAKNLYVPKPDVDYDLDQVAYSASLIKKRLITPVLREVISSLQPQGVLCDMGCSSGEVLISLCEEFNLEGIGFEKSPKMVELANKNIQMNTSAAIHAYYADYTNMKGIYPEVDLLICDFFMHHITDDDVCIEMLRSFKQTFPNSRYMLFMDNFTPEHGTSSPEVFAPAFDFVHRLQKIETRAYQSLEGIIKGSGFTIVERKNIEIPNGYLWLLEM